MTRTNRTGVCWLALLMVSLIAGGCASVNSGREVGELHLFGASAPLNLDTRPGPDGVGVRIYASAAGGTEGVPIRQGILEVLLFDGPVSAATARTQTPLKTWSFDPKNLKPFEGSSSLGVGYQLALRWTPVVPRQSSVTVIARYRGPQGAELWSTANIVPMSAK